ncbi:MAG TPA: outer membrane beta-barrel protein [Gemmatimonadales bacterium]|nr:outer membrane beta-barrel protein [Gemmatimonadales bacterium]
MRGNAWVARVVMAGGVLLAAAQPLLAQKISITPNIGVYVPTTELVKAASGEEFKQEMSITLGGRLGIMLSDRLGFEFTGAYAPSDLKVTASGLGDQNEDANIFTGSGRVSFHVIPQTSPISLLVTGGVGVVNRSGAFYADVEKKTDIGGTLGATAGFRLGRLIHLSVSAEDYIYKPKAEIPGFGPDDEKKMQNDIHLSFGVGIPLLGLSQLGR